MLDQAGRLEEGWKRRDRDARLRGQMREPRRSEGAPGETHSLAQIKEHPGGPDGATPAAEARKWKRSRQLPVPAALGSSRRPGNRSHPGRRGTLPVSVVQGSKGVVRLRGRRGSRWSDSVKAEAGVGPGLAFRASLCALRAGRRPSAPCPKPQRPAPAARGSRRTSDGR